MVADSVDYLLSCESNYRIFGGWISCERHKETYTVVTIQLFSSSVSVEGHKRSMWEVHYVLDPVRDSPDVHSMVLSQLLYLLSMLKFS